VGQLCFVFAVASETRNKKLETSLKGELMNFLAKLLRGIAFVPAVVHGIEALFGSKSGDEKKEAALSFVSSALSLTDAVLAKDVVDPEKFKDGLGKIIDGVVQCLNASAWAKAS
jgi:hypothetical protein